LFIHTGNRLAVRRVEFVSDRMPYNIILRASIQFLKYHMKILLRRA